MVGADHRKLIPAAVLIGGTLLVFVDLLCRLATWLVHQELPINVITAILGGPPLLLLLLLTLRGERG
ncbi:iron chelate uptake ABC transporter family permease subunit [Rhodococcus jostii]|uniref:iron chelate uptake ABC transporter family permease subunit n=1 Tax=Rhodococcus jostii TaxID=132919 RepID=UPI00362578C7